MFYPAFRGSNMVAFASCWKSRQLSSSNPPESKFKAG
jgi:hypothetical protein